jgi:hypothetical protein
MFWQVRIQVQPFDLPLPFRYIAPFFSGRIDMADCARCGGTGSIPDFIGGGLGGETCGDCGGSGRDPKSSEAVPAPDRGSGYVVTLGRYRTIKEAVAAGRYFNTDDSINDDNFPEPPPRAGKARLELVHFGKNLMISEIKSHLSARLLEPAGIWHLLAFGEQYDVQESVVALGSPRVISGDRFIPCIYAFSGIRDLHLHYEVLGARWHASYRFLAVRK